MRILHTSDLHGNMDLLLDNLNRDDYDIWIDCGDFFPNLTRGDVDIESTYQVRWFIDFEKEIVKRLNGRPFLSVSGNHDYACLATLMFTAGHEQSHSVNKEPVHMRHHGKILTFAGFREIPWIAGEWNGEKKDLTPYVARAMSLKPHVLLTHTPPAGIMDYSNDRGHVGSTVLANNLAYEKHNVKYNLFGHVHGNKGIEQHHGITFVNSTEGATFIDI